MSEPAPDRVLARSCTLDQAYQAAYQRLYKLYVELWSCQVEDPDERKHWAAQREIVAIRLEHDLREILYDEQLAAQLARPGLSH